MQAKSTVKLICPECGMPLTAAKSPESLSCANAHSHPVIDNIPRFVDSHNYAESFGLQWRVFRKTQLDSHTGVTITRDRLTRILGGDMSVVKGKTVLEAGCGAGRFTEILLENGAEVWATDLSKAIEANYENHAGKPGYQACQADLRNLPFPTESFDIVICVGVVQHTPDSKETIHLLSKMVKPGGLLAFDHYTYGYALPPSRTFLRNILKNTSPDKALAFCRFLTAMLWPIHTRIRNKGVPAGVRDFFLKASPVVDYHDDYAQIGPKLLREWALLDTFDTLTDFYKTLCDTDDLQGFLESAGMTDIAISPGGNGLEARAVKPVTPQQNG